MAHDKKNIMVILSSPSGVGKTTLTKNSAKYQSFKVSVSHTTRKTEVKRNRRCRLSFYI